MRNPKPKFIAKHQSSTMIMSELGIPWFFIPPLDSWWQERLKYHCSTKKAFWACHLGFQSSPSPLGPMFTRLATWVLGHIPCHARQACIYIVLSTRPMHQPIKNSWKLQSNLASTTLFHMTRSILQHILARPNFFVQDSTLDNTYDI